MKAAKLRIVLSTVLDFYNFQNLYETIVIMSRWDKQVMDQVSDVPSIIFFHNFFANIVSIYFLIFFHNFFYDFTK